MAGVVSCADGSPRARKHRGSVGALALVIASSTAGGCRDTLDLRAGADGPVESALLATVSVGASAVWAGHSLPLTVVVENTGASLATDVTPMAPEEIGCDGCLVFGSAFVPALVDLDADESATFTGSVRARNETLTTLPVQIQAAAAGVDDGTGATITSPIAFAGFEIHGYPPTACFTTSPKNVVANDLIQLDASCSSDPESPDPELTFEWDAFYASGAFTADTTGMTASVTAPTSGQRVVTYTFVLRVTDPEGRQGFTTRSVVVSDGNNNLACVTTVADESDPSANPGNPGGSGLSLREAITFANGRGGPDRTLICFDDGLGSATISLTAGSLPQIDRGVSLVGRPGISVDFGTNSAGFDLTDQADDSAFVGLTLLGGAGPRIRTEQFNDRVRISDSTISGGSGDGIVISGQDARVGPNNWIDGVGGRGIVIEPVASNTIVQSNLVRGGASHGIVIGEGGAAFQGDTRGNVITGNAGDGIRGRGSDLFHNTIHDNGGAGIRVIAGSGVTEVGNNVLSASGDCGVRSEPGTASVSDLGGNAIFGSVSSALCSVTPASTTRIDVDPSFVAPTNGDFRLSPLSPLRDAGESLPFQPDQNGAATGLFNGAAPDPGALETP